jgi:hypothetical protein
MNLEDVMSEPLGFFAWLVFGTFLLGWLGGCLIVMAEVFTEVRMTLQGVPVEERPKGHRVLKKYVRRDEFE